MKSFGVGLAFVGSFFFCFLTDYLSYIVISLFELSFFLIYSAFAVMYSETSPFLLGCPFN